MKHNAGLTERKEWTATAIIKERLNGLKLDAKVWHRSVGGQLDYILEEHGIQNLTDSQLVTEVGKLRKSKESKQ